MNTGVYRITNTVNGKHYIGSSVDMTKRWEQHRRELRQSKHHSAKLQSAWIKHGGEGFEFAVILLCRPCDLLMYEQACLDFYASPKLGYNMLPTAGSHLGKKRSHDTRKRQSIAAKNSMTPERREALSLAAKNGMTEDRRRLMSSISKGRKVSEEAKRNMSLAAVGKVLSAETRAKMSMVHKAMWAAKRAEKEAICGQ